MFPIRVIILSTWVCFTSLALAEERIALVVGNGTYGSIAPLANPVSDATLMANSLNELGFDVLLLKNATLIELKRGVAHFGRKLRAGGKDTTGLFYYAGHGVQSFDANYLLPVDTSLTDAADLDLEAVDASSILRQMFSARNKTNIVILDACRNNPFDDIAGFNDSGLAEMKAPTGTFLAYATAPGDVALDGTTGNSPFTAALAEEMVIPGKPIEQVFKQVRVKVLKQSNGSQTPWDTSSLTDQFYFSQPIALSKEELAERQMWDSVRFSRDMLQIMLFLRSYPESKFGNEAKKLLTEIVIELSSTEPVAETGNAKATNAEPVAVTVEPEIREQDMIAVAQASGKIADYEAYVAKFPYGVFTELAKIEIISLRESLSTDAEAMPVGNSGLVIISNTELAKAANSEDGLSTRSKPAIETESSVLSEQELIDIAQSTGDLADYEAYLATFPNGIYAELVKFEIVSILETRTAEAEVTTTKVAGVASTATSEQPSSVASGEARVITYQSILAIGPPGIIGKSIEKLVKGSPLFPPIEGLPDEYWVDQTCSNCHVWSREALCTQSNAYTGENSESRLGKKHPYGGPFKQHLGLWSAGGCQ